MEIQEMIKVRGAVHAFFVASLLLSRELVRGIPQEKRDEAAEALGSFFMLFSKLLEIDMDQVKADVAEIEDQKHMLN